VRYPSSQRDKKSIQNFRQKTERRNSLGELGIGEMIMFQWIVEK
jgi:hypothetical protein